MELCKTKGLVILFLVVSVLMIGISPQEKAKLALGAIVDEWFSGNYEEALQDINSTLETSVDPFDIPKFYYMRAKVEVDLGRIEDALKDLRSMLAVSFGTPEVISMLKEIGYLMGLRPVPENLRVSKLLSIKGILNDVEYFYTLEDMAISSKKIYAIDRVNSRLLIYSEDGVLRKAVPLPFRPLSIEVSPGDEVFISSKSGGIYEYDGSSLKEIYSGLRSPILAGFDRTGRLWWMDGYNIYWMFKGVVKKKNLSISMIPVDVEVNHDGIWILDVLNQRVILVSKENFAVLRMVPLPVGARAFELTPLGSMFILSSDGEVYYFKKMKELVKIGISSPSIVGFDYKYPFLICSDWKKNEINLYLITEGEPFFVRLVGYKRKAGNVKVNVRIEGYNGFQIPFADKFMYVEIDGGRLSPVVEVKPVKVDSYKSGKDFITDRLPLLKKRFGVDVLVPPDTYYSKGAIVTLRSKGVRLFVDGKGEDKLMRASTLSGGEMTSDIPDNWKYLWNVNLKYVPDVAVRVHTVSVGVKIFDQSYFDTFYLVDKGTGIGEKSR